MEVCHICGALDIVSEMVLKDYPITNIYLDRSEESANYVFDAKITQCKCGHVQLRSTYDTTSFYTENYQYNGYAATVVARRNTGVKLINNYIRGFDPHCIVDIGCGQLSMLKALGGGYLKSKLIGLDPVPLQQNVDRLRIEFLNEEFTGQLTGIHSSSSSNLYILDNVMEHIFDLTSFMDNLLSNTKVGDFVYVCVPSFDLISKKMQFQEFIHEHCHYFKIKELEQLFTNFGFKVLESFSSQDDGRSYNYHMFIRDDYKSRNINTDGEDIVSALDAYRGILKVINENIQTLDRKIYGVCASELTPTLAYFMESDFDFCQAIFDTSPHKAGKYIVKVKPPILGMEEVLKIKSDAYFFITAPNLALPVMNNMKRYGIEDFIVPALIV